MVHSVVLLFVLVGAGPLAAQIPTALLAGILIKVGLDIIDWGFLLRAHKLSLKTASVMYGVLFMTVFWARGLSPKRSIDKGVTINNAKRGDGTH